MSEPILVAEDLHKSYGDNHAVRGIDPAQKEATGIVAGIVNRAVNELGAAAEIRYGIGSVLEETGVLDGAPEEVRQAVEAQTLGVIWTQVQQIRHNPVIAVRSEDLKGTRTRPDAGPMDWYIAGFAVMFAFSTVTAVSRSKRLPHGPSPLPPTHAGL
jgi:hypothetical protein